MGAAATDDERFEDFVGYITALSREVQRIRAAESAKLGLQGADIMVLHYLGHAQRGMTGSELARAVGVSRAAVSRTLARMEDEGLVEVSFGGADSTRYRAPVQLTEQGRVASVEADKRISGVMDAVKGAQSNAERVQMYRSLQKVLACLETLARD